jgi:hypothetical protein
MNFPIIVDRPLRFGLDPDTRQLIVSADVSLTRQLPGGATLSSDLTYALVLREETARALLRDLPELERLLERSIEGNTKPNFLQ